MYSVFSYNVPNAFVDVLWALRRCGQQEESRNGPVWTIQEPFTLTIQHPWERVLTDPDRDANPFFHVMEFVWMMAGSNDIRWVAQFNKQMLAYSNDGLTQPAAYGYRWRRHFSYDQISIALTMLKKDPTTRRVVLGMWSPKDDLGFLTTKDSADIPCNTQIILRIVRGKLDFLVTNRSNDAIWGMLGANAVHMTFLQELMANALGVPVGKYQVVTNNLHIYEGMPKFDYYWKSAYDVIDVYNRLDAHVPVLQATETYEQFISDASYIVSGLPPKYTFWMKNVAWPIHQAWFDRSKVGDIIADDWRIAAMEWVERRKDAALADKRADHNASVDDGKHK